MRWILSMAILLPGTAFADCAFERSFVFQAVQLSSYNIENVGELEESQGSCRVTGITLSQAALSFDIAELSWRLEGLENLQSGQGRLSLTANMQGARFVPQTTDPWVDYMLSQQNRRSLIDASLVASWDLDEGLAELASFRVAMPGENAFGLDFRVRGLSSKALTGQLSELSDISLEYLAVELENRGFADGLILGYLVGQFSSLPGDPASVVEATKLELTGMISEFPNEVFSNDSKKMLSDLVMDMPVPWGEVFLSVAASPALPFDRFFTLGMSPDPLAPNSLADAFRGATVSVIYTPVEEDD